MKRDIQHNDTKHNAEPCYAEFPVMLSVIYAECRIQALYVEWHYAECRYAEYHYAECRYAECRKASLTHLISAILLLGSVVCLLDLVPDFALQSILKCL